LGSCVKPLIFENLKVKRIKKNAKEYFKYITINLDLEDYLNQMEMEHMLGKDEYILYPERDINSKGILDILSKSFTYYK
jgi:hypothetical protein